MTLKVLGSSSSGNCYILQNDREALILDAGVRPQEVKRALGYDVAKVCGCLITHEHGDHAAYVDDILGMGIPVYASRGTIDAMRMRSARRPVAVKPGTMFHAGRFEVIAFRAKHDSAEPFGYYIRHAETGNVLFATDTYYLPCSFAGLNNILLECNYDRSLLEESIREGRVSPVVRNRTIQSHMSYENCIKTLKANDLSAVNNIVLIHLSANNADPGMFRRGVKAATGKTVHVASAGMTIEFNKTPF